MEKDIEKLAREHAKELTDTMIPRLENYWFSGKKIEIYPTDMENLLDIFTNAFVEFAEKLNG